MIQSWERNDIQFARLIAELEAAGVFEQSDLVGLCESMDITEAQLMEIVGRAQKRWNSITEPDRVEGVCLGCDTEMVYDMCNNFDCVYYGLVYAKE